MTPELQAWTEGIRACEDGKPITDNPYMDDPKLHTEWAAGWNLSAVIERKQHVG